MTGREGSKQRLHPCARKRSQAVATAAFTAAVFTMLASTADGTIAPTRQRFHGKPVQRTGAAPAGSSHALRRNFNRHGGMRHGVQPERNSAHPFESGRFPGEMPQCYSTKVTLLISFMLVMPGANFGQTAFAQSDHALFARDALDFRSRTPIHDHFANAIRQVQQFANRGAAMIPRAGTFQASGAFGKRDVRPDRRIQARFFQFLSRILLRASCNSGKLREPAAAP